VITDWRAKGIDVIEELCDPLGMLVVEDPADDQVIGRVATFSPAQVEDSLRLASEVRREWASRSARARMEVLRTWHDLLLARTDEMARIVTRESGKPLDEGRSEVKYAAAYLRWFAEEGVRAYGETIPTFTPEARIFTTLEPVGTSAAITPWNFPLAMITRKAGPALAAGCSMVLKPAEATPLSALALQKLASEAGVPDGLFQVVPTCDPEAIGEVFCTNPHVRKLTFTGSTQVGKILMAGAARNVLRVSMELGGNAPFIVFDDADLEAAVEGAMIAKFRNAGQTCVAANRILVQSGIHDEFVQEFVRRVESLKVAPGLAETCDMGPLINARACDRVAALVQSAGESGCEVTTGGNTLPALGPNFYAPTILTGANNRMDVSQEEIFGPVAPVLRFDDVNEAINLANDTTAGLAAYIYTRDLGRTWRVMESLEYGMVAINEGVLSSEVIPFGGIKESGLGREGSRHGLNDYMELKYCLAGGINRPA